MNDTSLKQHILDELEFQPEIDANDIGVTVENGIVTLTGHVPNYSRKLAVERAVGRLERVKGIAQEIEVRYAGAHGTSDDEIAQRAVNTIKWNTMVPDDKVQVKVQDLTGTLDWNYEKAGAERAVRDLNGVRGVGNLIELRQRVLPKDVKKHIVSALHRNAAMEAEAIHVDEAGNKVTLAGKVRTWTDREIAEQAAWATSGVTVVEDKLTVG